MSGSDELASVHAARVAVIFNADSRLGRAMAVELATQGFSLALCSEHPASLENTVDEAFNSCEISPFKVSAYECSLIEPQSVEICAREIFEDFGRLDVVCFVERRLDEVHIGEEDDDEDDDIVPILGNDGHILRSLTVDTSDVAFILDCFYPLLKAPKPTAPPMRFFDHIPQGAKPISLHENEDDDDEDLMHSKKATSLFLYLSTPDTVACRAGRSAICSRVRTCEAMMEGLNAEAIARGDNVRAVTAVVGTLDGEIPFWRFDREMFLRQAAKCEQIHKKRLEEELRKINESKVSEGSSSNKKEMRSASFEILQTMIPKRLLHRRASRSRGLPPLEEKSVHELEEDDDDDEDKIPPPSPMSRTIFVPQRLTSESLTHIEACAWISWGLSRGRTRILVGYDLLFLESAWVPNAFLNRLFSFNGAARNLLPTRTKDDFIASTYSAKRAQAIYDAARSRRQRAREIVTLILTLFFCFTPGVALLLLFLVFVWHRTVTSDDGHAATERAVSAVLFFISLRRRSLVKKIWESFRDLERKVFGTIARTTKDLKLRVEDALYKKRRGHSRQKMY
jgi:hypothetical protein